MSTKPAASAEVAPAHGTTVDALVDKLRALIREQGLGVGDPLPTERELGERFSASRNTVREALRTLKTFGLIDVRPKVGAIIVDRGVAAAFDLFSANMDVSQETFSDVQGFRRVVEIGMAEEIINTLATADLEALDAINAAMRDAVGVEATAELDFRFHSHLVGMARNRTLSEIYRFLKPVVMRLMLLGKSRRRAIDGTFDGHAGIIDALRKRDRIAYAYLMARHLEFGARFLETPHAPADSAARTRPAKP